MREADSDTNSDFRAVKIVSDLLHFFTAAFYGLVGVYAGRDGGQLLLFLTLSHLRVDTVDEALYSRHL